MGNIFSICQKPIKTLPSENPMKVVPPEHSMKMLSKDPKRLSRNEQISLVIEYWFRVVCKPDKKIPNELIRFINKYAMKLWITKEIEERISMTQAFCTKDNKVIIIGAIHRPEIYLINNNSTFDIIADYPNEIKLYGHCAVQIPGKEEIFLSFGGNDESNQHLISYNYTRNKIVNIQKENNINFNKYFIGSDSKSQVLGNFNEYVIITGGGDTDNQLLIYSIENQKFVYQNKQFSIKFGSGHSIIRISFCKYLIVTVNNLIYLLFIDPYNEFNNSIKLYKSKNIESLFGEWYREYGVISIGSHIIFFGGRSKNNAFENRIYMYDTSSEDGEILISDILLPEKRFGISCVLVKDRIYVIGCGINSYNYWSLSIYALFDANLIVHKSDFSI